jgi:hypothetical protein
MQHELEGEDEEGRIESGKKQNYKDLNGKEPDKTWAR